MRHLDRVGYSRYRHCMNRFGFIRVLLCALLLVIAPTQADVMASDSGQLAGAPNAMSMDCHEEDSGGASSASSEQCTSCECACIIGTQTVDIFAATDIAATPLTKSIIHMGIVGLSTLRSLPGARPPRF